MSRVPMFYRDWWREDPWGDSMTPPVRTSRLVDQHFGAGLFSEDLHRAMFSCHPQQLRRLGFARPWADFGLEPPGGSGRMQINLDVQQFTPDEITVKTVDSTIVVEGRHDERQDEHGYIARHFVRRYVLPGDHDPKDVVSSLSSDGVLTIVAPKRQPVPERAAVNERTIPVQRVDQEPPTS